MRAIALVLSLIGIVILVSACGADVEVGRSVRVYGFEAVEVNGQVERLAAHPWKVLRFEAFRYSTQYGVLLAPTDSDLIDDRLRLFVYDTWMSDGFVRFGKLNEGDIVQFELIRGNEDTKHVFERVKPVRLSESEE